MRDVVSAPPQPTSKRRRPGGDRPCRKPCDGREAATRGRGRGRQVRVNLVGYAATGTKRAYLMSGAAETGATFAVKSGSTTVLSGASARTWARGATRTATSTRSTSTRSTTAGTYTIAVSGPAPATRLPFTVNTGAAVYPSRCATRCRFYQVQRDGPNYVPSALRTAPAPTSTTRPR